jgi:hypothetical protein
MKKYIGILLVSLIIIFFLASCKKDNTTTAKDYGALVKAKIWTGEFTYTGQPTGYYSVQFNADSTSIWSELGGPYTGGKWSLSGKQLTIIQNSTLQSKGDISDDNKLINITNSNAFMTLNSGQLNTYGDMILDGQTWRGTVTNGAGITTNTTLAFNAGLKLNFSLGLTTSMGLSYERVGASVRFTSSGITYFGVIMPNGTDIKGQTHGGADKYNWQITKQ